MMIKYREDFKITSYFGAIAAASAFVGALVVNNGIASLTFLITAPLMAILTLFHMVIDYPFEEVK